MDVLKEFFLCLFVLISPSTSLRLTIGQGKEPWESRFWGLDDPLFKEYYNEFEKYSPAQKVEFLHRWEASMPASKWKALLYLYANIPIIDKDGEIIGAQREPGTPDLPTYDCPMLIVKPNREHPYCFSVFSWEHAHCLSIWDIGAHNATYMCGKCSDYGWTRPFREDPAFDHNVLWTSGVNADDITFKPETQIQKMIKKARTVKVNLGLRLFDVLGKVEDFLKKNMSEFSIPGVDTNFPYCNSRGLLEAGEATVENLGHPAHTGNAEPSAVLDPDQSKAYRAEWNNMWFLDPKKLVFFGGPYGANIDDLMGRFFHAIIYGWHHLLALGNFKS